MKGCTNLETDQAAQDIKNSYAELVLAHKNSFDRIVQKHLTKEIQIPQAIFYMSWFQLYLSVKEFRQKFLELKKLAGEDKTLESYLRQDTEIAGKEFSSRQVEFFLEEHLAQMLITKGKAQLPNYYIQGREKWILWCYPGKPPKALVYLFQLNPFDLENSANPYEAAQYDLESKKLYDFNRIDLATWDYT